MDADAHGAKHQAVAAKPIDNPLLYAAATLSVQMPRLPPSRPISRRARKRQWHARHALSAQILRLDNINTFKVIYFQ